MGGIEGRDEGGAVDHERLGVALGQEVAAGRGVGVACALGGGGTLPPHGSHAVEQSASAHQAGGHLLQVVSGGQIIGREHLGLQGAAIAIDLHLIYIREAGLAHQCLSELIDARLGHADLHPLPRGQHGMLGIAACGRGGARGTRFCCGLSLQREPEADQLLPFPFAEDQGDERHIECALAAADAHILLHLGQLGQRVAAQRTAAGHIGLAHINKLGIFYADTINRVGIVGA